MKNKKLKLKEIKVKSFVTQSNDRLAETIKGGRYRQISGSPCSEAGSDVCGSNGCGPGLTAGVFCQPPTAAAEVCGVTQQQCTQQGFGCTGDQRCPPPPC